MYEKLLTEAERAIIQEREEKIRDSIKAKLIRKQQLIEDIEELDKEIKQLVKEGRIKDLSSYIKIGDGIVSGSTSCISINKS